MRETKKDTKPPQKRKILPVQAGFYKIPGPEWKKLWFIGA
jgi:hypothetical protein